jgi:hypothetical protein
MIVLIGFDGETAHLSSRSNPSSQAGRKAHLADPLQGYCARLAKPPALI